MKKIGFTSLFLYFVSIFFSFSQQKKSVDQFIQLSIDSLKNLNEKSKSSNPELAITYIEALLEKEVNEDSENSAYGYHQLGSIHQIMGNYNRSLEYYDKSIYISKKIKNTSKLALLYKEKGNTYYYLNDFKNALSNYQKCIEIAKSTKNKQQEILGYSNIALIKKKIGQHQEALKIEKENIARANTVHLLLNLSGTYLNLKKNDSAIFYGKIGLEKSRKINDDEEVSYFYNTLGVAYYNKENYTEALSYFFNALAIIEKLKNKKRITSTLFLIGRTYLASNNTNQAIVHLKKAENTVADIPGFYSIDLEGTYKLLAEIYSSKNDHEKSKAYLEKYVILDSLNDINKTEIISDLYYVDLNKKEGLLKSLLKEKKGFILAIIIGVCIVIALAYILIMYRKRWLNNKKELNLHLLEVEKKQVSISKKNIKITDQKAKEILKKLQKTELKGYYLKSDFSLSILAKKLKTNPTYLSKIINDYKEKKFTQYTNELRINYALKRLKEDSKFRSYSILHIAQELGYKSQDSFSRHFKKQTGIYPSSYISGINKN